MDAEQEPVSLPTADGQHPDNGDPTAVEVDYSDGPEVLADDAGLDDLLPPVTDDDPIVGD